MKAAMSFFEKKFKDKTGNAWTDRDKFEIKPKKYQMLEMAAADEEDEEPADAVDAVVEAPKKVIASFSPTTPIINYLTHEHALFL